MEEISKQTDRNVIYRKGELYLEEPETDLKKDFTNLFCVTLRFGNIRCLGGPVRIISYRGPKSAGGVSNALEQVFKFRSEVTEWSYVSNLSLELSNKDGNTQSQFKLGQELLQGHYRYCNEFLWPILHDLSQYAHYDENDRRYYQTLNYAASLTIPADSSERYFVNDYQFGVLPSFLSGNQKSFLFWHIPWPARIHSTHVDPIRELASGMLRTNAIGFHTREYLFNFLDFIKRFCSNRQFDRRDTYVTSFDPVLRTAHRTKLFVAPIGTNNSYWNEMSLREDNQYCLPYPELPYVLSVDRIDYTKGVKDRFHAINRFFELYPQWQGKIFFVQIGTRSRMGLSVFDQYWHECSELANQINERWRCKNWQPLVWIEQPLESQTLAKIYSNASVMLVTPWRDGLNLTAKEFIASRNLEKNPGVLALSPGAGVWHEIGENTISVSPSDPDEMAKTLMNCLIMDNCEKQSRMKALIRSVNQNDLNTWWQVLSNAFNHSQTVMTHPIELQRAKQKLLCR